MSEDANAHEQKDQVELKPFNKRLLDLYQMVRDKSRLLTTDVNVDVRFDEDFDAYLLKFHVKPNPSFAYKLDLVNKVAKDLVPFFTPEALDTVAEIVEKLSKKLPDELVPGNMKSAGVVHHDLQDWIVSTTHNDQLVKTGADRRYHLSFAQYIQVLDNSAAWLVHRFDEWFENESKQADPDVLKRGSRAITTFLQASIVIAMLRLSVRDAKRWKEDDEHHKVLIAYLKMASQLLECLIRVEQLRDPNENRDQVIMRLQEIHLFPQLNDPSLLSLFDCFSSKFRNRAAVWFKMV